MEIDFVVGSATMLEAVWLRRFWYHLGVTESSKDPLMIHCDNKAAIALPKILLISLEDQNTLTTIIAR